MEVLTLPAALRGSATPLADWVVVAPVLLLLVGAALLLILPRVQRLQFALTGLVLAAVIACETALLLRVHQAGPLSMTMGNWLPPFGISLTVDLLGAVLALAASGVALVVLLYAQADRPHDQAGDGFYPLVLLLLAGVTGAFLTGDLFNLYVWFEVMLIASFGLLAMGGKPIQLDATLKYGMLNFLATALFLLALGLLYGALGTLNMADIWRVAPAADAAAMTSIAALLLLAFGMKAAAFPVNAWLPAAYHAPHPAISALLAGLPTKVGAYALIRTLVMLLPASRDLLEPALVMIAIGTLVLAPLGAIAETNLRRALGFLVIGGIGAILAGIATGGAGAIGGTVAYILHAMLTMTGLYLVAGLIERHTGQVDTRYMGGVYAANAPLSIIFLLLILGAAGVPPLLGFWPKLMLLEGGIGRGGWIGWGLTTALLLNSFLTLIAGSRLWSHVFWRSGEASMHSRLSLPLRQAALAALVTVIVAAGLWPNALFAIARISAADVLGPGRYIAAVGLAEDGP